GWGAGGARAPGAAGRGVPAGPLGDAPGGPDRGRDQGRGALRVGHAVELAAGGVPRRRAERRPARTGASGPPGRRLTVSLTGTAPGATVVRGVPACSRSPTTPSTRCHRQRSS